MGGYFMKKILFRTVLIVTLFSVTFFLVQRAEGREKPDQIEILVIGSGKIIKGNLADARKNAISEALVKGVEEYLARYLGSQVLINNFSRLVQDVMPTAREEIENFHILAENKSEDYYTILIRIKVNEKLMDEKLREMGIILMEGPPIKVLFLVSQKKMQAGEVSYWWSDPENNALLTSTELVLHRIFQERGFSPVNRLSSVPEENLSPEMRKQELSGESIINWANLFSSDIVITGESEIVEDEMVSISLRAVDVQRNLVISQIQRVETITEEAADTDNITAALERVINDIAVNLGPEIIKSFKESEDVQSSMEVELRNLKSFAQFRIFKDFLQNNIDRIKSVVQTRIKGDSITVMVSFSGKADTFFNEMKNHDKFPFLADVSITGEGRAVIEIR